MPFPCLTCADEPATNSDAARDGVSLNSTFSGLLNRAGPTEGRVQRLSRAGLQLDRKPRQSAARGALKPPRPHCPLRCQ